MKQITLIAFLASFAVINLSFLHAQGSLTPPGAPAPTMLTLSQIQPRIPISSAPYTITQPGSYYLTGNLFVSAAANAITVQASEVTIDLNGYSIFADNSGFDAIVVPNVVYNLTVRNGTLEGWQNGIAATPAISSLLANVQCYESLGTALAIGTNSIVSKCSIVNPALGGSGYGIQAGDGTTIDHCAIQNSFNFFSYGILAGRGCMIESSTVSSNYFGIIAGDGTTIKSCTLTGNRDNGVEAGNGCRISDCTACDNGFVVYGIPAITTGGGCTITGCSVSDNSSGIYTGTGSTIRDCTVISNALTGLNAGAGCTICDCTANYNTNGIVANSECTITGCTASANYIDGIQTTFSCLIKGNTCSSNSRYVITGGAGIHVLDSGNRIEGNVLNSNQYGIKADGTENLIIANAARGSGSDNYNIVSGNMVDTIVSATASGAVLGSTGGTSLGTTDPWANFSF